VQHPTHIVLKVDLYFCTIELKKYKRLKQKKTRINDLRTIKKLEKYYQEKFSRSYIYIEDCQNTINTIELLIFIFGDEAECINTQDWDDLTTYQISIDKDNFERFVSDSELNVVLDEWTDASGSYDSHERLIEVQDAYVHVNYIKYIKAGQEYSIKIISA